MADLIDKEVLYNHFANLEAIALEQVINHMHDEDLTKWRIWSAILQERIAYKNDVFDAPDVDAEPVKHGHWIWMGEQGDSRYMCSVCKSKEDVPTCNGEPTVWEYCPNCGAKMDEVKENDADG